MTTSILPVIWYFLICAELALYILLDGANLGSGIVSLFPQKEAQRASMLSTLSPIWNANETWLLVAAGTLFGAFPEVYSIGLNALYAPSVVILIGLLLRAVSFEFHAYATNKALWTRVFGIGSLITAIGHGLLVGGLLSGITITDGHFGGTAYDWFTPLTFLITIGTVSSYVVLGYAYLIGRMKYENQQETFSRLVKTAGLTFIALLGATVFLPKTNYIFLTRWTTYPSMYYLAMIAFLIGIFSLLLAYYVIRKIHPERLYELCLSIFALGFAGMLIGTYPYMIPPTLTLFEAASPDNTLAFMLWGIGPILPIVLGYNYYLHKIFSNSSTVREASYEDS